MFWLTHFALDSARDSQPEEVDKLERAKLQLEIELEALKSEHAKNKKDESSKLKIEDVKFQLAKLDEELAPIKVSRPSIRVTSFSSC